MTIPEILAELKELLSKAAMEKQATQEAAMNLDSNYSQENHRKFWEAGVTATLVWDELKQKAGEAILPLLTHIDTLTEQLEKKPDFGNTFANINDTCRSRGFNAGPSGRSTEDRVIALAQAYDKATEQLAVLQQREWDIATVLEGKSKGERFAYRPELMPERAKALTEQLATAKENIRWLEVNEDSIRSVIGAGEGSLPELVRGYVAERDKRIAELEGKR